MNMIPKCLADLGLHVNRLYYKQFLHDVYFRDGAPSWFDHRIDLYYQWPNNLFWLERGILPRKYLFEGCKILDLFCGDGFYSRYFHSTIAGHIDALDKDPSAIEHAQRFHSHPKINYHTLDITHDELPLSHYDIVLWFEGIEHLTEEECGIIFGRIKNVIGDEGLLFGSTPIINEADKGKGNWEHKYEFTSCNQLLIFLNNYFKDVMVDTTIYPTLEGGQRKTAYFTCRCLK